MTRSYELLVTDTGKERRRVVWDGADGPDAAQRYANGHPGRKVLAWRDWPRVGLFAPADYRRVRP